MTVVVSLALFLLRAPLATLFQLEGDARTLVFLFAGPLSHLWFFNGVIFVGNAAYNNLGRPFFSTSVNWGLHTLGTVPLIMLGSMWCGAPGVLIGQSVGGIIFGLASWWLALRVLAAAQGQVAAPSDNELRVHRVLNNRL